MRYVGAKHQLGLVEAFQEQTMTPVVHGVAPPETCYYPQHY